MSSEVFVSESILLRPVKEADFEKIHRLVIDNAHHLRKWMPDLVERNRTPEHSERFTLDCIGKEQECEIPDYAILFRDELAGILSFHPPDLTNKSIEVGFWLGEAFQGRGIVSQALECAMRHLSQSHGLREIKMTTAENNHRARALAERLGFQFTGLIPNAEMIDGISISHAAYSRPLA